MQDTRLNDSGLVPLPQTKNGSAASLVRQRGGGGGKLVSRIFIFQWLLRNRDATR
ncbi:hypothetical protein Isop_2465 [Isosphaera pallida ATCC 43644]|uniref:Uncharacterized protein n=1 Tax=Isosphaera pallida (strain ATCC 43644 / DSM 9630 / IS1B) TaxID=575540 RepID=E8QXJ0_ISOPI|nr:hypothetical protein Isop_2465 [Isosphaera pallida ATCC 43644]